MRVDCYQCGAAYRIPDEAVGPGGIRAECPKCGHQETIRPERTYMGPAPTRRPDAPAPEPPPAGPQGDERDVLFDFARVPDAPDRPAAPERPAAPPPAPPPLPRRNAPAPPAPGGVIAAADDDPFAALDTGPSAPAAGAPAGAAAAAVASEPLADLDADPFDALDFGAPAAPIGAIDPTPPPTPAPASAPAGPTYRIKKPDGRVLGPASFSQLEAMAAAAEIAPGDQVARDQDEFRLLSQYEECAPLLEKAAANFRVRTARGQVQREKGARWPLAVGLVVLLAAGGVLGAARLKPGLLPEAVRGPLVALVGPEKPEGPANPVLDQVPLYRLQLVEVSGSPDAHLAVARAKMAEDTSAGYRAADGELKQALILDPDRPEAVARLVLNAAYLGGWHVDAETQGTFDAYAGYLEAAHPDSPWTPLARAADALLKGPAHAPEARRAAEAAVKRGGDDLVAKLVLARAVSYIDHDAATKMLEAFPAGTSPRVTTELGHVCREAGDFACAEAAFRRRLQATPGHEEASAELARLYVLLGRYGEARKVYQDILKVDPDRVDAELAIATLDYQMDDRIGAAARRLQRLRTRRIDLADPETARMIRVHGATVARLQGKLELAEKLVKEVLDETPSHGPAAYQGVLLAELRGDHARARQLLPTVVAAGDERGSQHALAAVVEAGEGDYDSAARNARMAADADPAGLRWLLLAAALEGERGRPAQAYLLMRRVIRVDPEEAIRSRALTDYYDGGVSAAVTRRGFEALVEADPEQGLAYAGLGISRWLAGDRGRAKATLERALSLDAENLPAYLYLGELSLESGRPDAAARAFAKAVRADRLAPLPRYLYGRAMELRGKGRPARKAYGEALRLDPNFHLAEVRLVVMDAKGRGRADARRKLREVLVSHPDSMAAREALYDLN